MIKHFIYLFIGDNIDKKNIYIEIEVHKTLFIYYFVEETEVAIN